MSKLDDYFRPDLEETYDHPLLRMVDEDASRREVKSHAVEVLRSRDTLGFKPAKLYLHRLDAAGKDVLPYQVEEWDDSLNAALVKKGIRALSPENEKIRFSLGLRAALQPSETRFGDGYYNAILVHYLEESPFARHSVVEPVLKHVYRPGVDSSQRTFTECMERIDSAIRGRARELAENLKYNRSEAEDILAAAVAQYLDERFSVTNRKLMGLL